jgi:hypothetical protein
MLISALKQLNLVRAIIVTTHIFLDFEKTSQAEVSKFKGGLI